MNFKHLMSALSETEYKTGNAIKTQDGTKNLRAASVLVMQPKTEIPQGWAKGQNLP
jgi:hypothetical protein